MLTQIGLDTPNLAKINFLYFELLRGGTNEEKTPCIFPYSGMPCKFCSKPKKVQVQWEVRLVEVVVTVVIRAVNPKRLSVWPRRGDTWRKMTAAHYLRVIQCQFGEESSRLESENREESGHGPIFAQRPPSLPSHPTKFSFVFSLSYTLGPPCVTTAKFSTRKQSL